jgi:hypothetical protein
MIKKFEGEKVNFLKLLCGEQEKNSRRRISSPRVFLLLSAKNFFTESCFLRRELLFFTLGEELFAESPRFGLHQRVLLSAKAPFLVVCLWQWENILLDKILYPSKGWN